MNKIALQCKAFFYISIGFLAFNLTSPTVKPSSKTFLIPALRQAVI
jgi:hypothetical protein